MKRMERPAAMFGSKVLPFDQEGDFFFRRGMNKLDSNKLLDAMAYYRVALSKDPENSEVKLAIAETLTEMNRFEESNRMLFTLFSAEKSRPSECYFGMGCNFVGMQEYERAKDSFIHYLELDPEGEFMCEAYDMLDVLEDGTQEEINEARLQHTAREGKELLERDDYVGAIKVFNALLKEAPDLSYARNNLALAYFCNRDFKSATEQVQLILADEQDNIQAHCNLAIFLRAVKDKEGVERETEFLCRAKTDDTDDLNRMSITLMELGRFREAYPLIKRLFMQMPYDTGITHRLAVCAYENGDYYKAMDCYDRLIKLDDKDSVARYYCGICRAAAAGAHKRCGFMFNYQVPLEEMLTRVHRLNELIGKPHSELLAMWNDGTELESLMRWGAELTELSVKHAILTMVSSFEDEKAELFLRDFVLQRGQPPEMKREAFGLLKHMDAKEPYLGYINGELVESRVNLIRMLPDTVPDAYQEVIEVCFAAMQGERSEDCLLAAADLWGEYVGNLSGFARLSDQRIMALAAALEYIVCREKDEKLTKASMCKKYGVTLVRFNNALAQLMNSPNKEI
ncbi:MAG: tetratricopeptide repeat protein [Clostridia bacterium]